MKIRLQCQCVCLDICLFCELNVWWIIFKLMAILSRMWSLINRYCHVRASGRTVVNVMISSFLNEFASCVKEQHTTQTLYKPPFFCKEKKNTTETQTLGDVCRSKENQWEPPEPSQWTPALCVLMTSGSNISYWWRPSPCVMSFSLGVKPADMIFLHSVRTVCELHLGLLVMWCSWISWCTAPFHELNYLSAF